MLLLLAALWVYKELHERELGHEREVIVRNEDGDVLFTAPVVPMMGSPKHGVIFEAQLSQPSELGQVLYIQLPPMPAPAQFAWLGLGPDNSIQWVVWFFIFLGLGLAFATYPLTRRLTKRLDCLQKEVSFWGEGNLSKRATVQGHDEVAMLAQSFNEAAQQIEKLVLSQKTLLANASHELRSPLARIRMGLALAPELADTDLRQELDLNLQELDQIIDEILLTSRLNSGAQDVLQFERSAFEVLDLAELVQEELDRQSGQIQVHLRIAQSPIRVWASPKLLRRVLRNLVQNAVRYGKGTIDILLELDSGVGSSEAQCAKLTVSDAGPGVPKDLRQRIFEPFYRLPGTAEHQGGVGLGLALVASIAQLHYGSVACIDRKDGRAGACFELCLPVVNSEIESQAD